MVFLEWELFQETERVVVESLRVGAGRTRTYIVLDKCVNAQPSVLLLNEF